MIPSPVVKTIQLFCLIGTLLVMLSLAVVLCIAKDGYISMQDQNEYLQREKRLVEELLSSSASIKSVDINDNGTNLRSAIKSMQQNEMKQSQLSANQRNTAANEIFSLPELPNGVVGDLARMFASPDEDEVWRDYCLQFLGSALEREDGVTDDDRALARETLVKALASTNATFAGTALRALHRGDPADSLVASNALRIARDPSYPSSSRTTALLILEECVRAAEPVAGPQVASPQVPGPKSILPDGEPSTSSTPSTFSTPSTSSTLAEIATAISADPTASPLLRRTAEAVARRHAADAD